MTFFKLGHLIAVLIWVGGMLFSYAVLRPAGAETLQPPERLRLWDNVFHRFFNWVWGANVAILATGFYMIYQCGGMAHVSNSIRIMLLLGLAMTAIYCYVFFACYVPFNLHVARERWKEAGEILDKIRKLVAVNLTLGLLTIAVVELGRT
jgi:uncharacterized membrane protein